MHFHTDTLKTVVCCVSLRYCALQHLVLCKFHTVNNTFISNTDKEHVWPSPQLQLFLSMQRAIEWIQTTTFLMLLMHILVTSVITLGHPRESNMVWPTSIWVFSLKSTTSLTVTWVWSKTVALTICHFMWSIMTSLSGSFSTSWQKRLHGSRIVTNYCHSSQPYVMHLHSKCSTWIISIVSAELPSHFRSSPGLWKLD